VPLNSPRLLIRHWIPSTRSHTDIHTKLQEESISRPTRTDYAIQPPRATRPGTTISTTHCIFLILAIMSNDLHTLMVNPDITFTSLNCPTTRHSKSNHNSIASRHCHQHFKLNEEHPCNLNSIIDFSSKQLLILRLGLYPKVRSIISTKPILSLQSKHPHERSFNKFFPSHLSILTNVSMIQLLNFTFQPTLTCQIIISLCN
jgi:hypothetical protein